MLTEHDVITRSDTLLRFWRLDGDLAAAPHIASMSQAHAILSPAFAPATKRHFFGQLQGFLAPHDPLQAAQADADTSMRIGATYLSLYLSLEIRCCSRIRRSWRALSQPTCNAYREDIDSMSVASAAISEQFASLRPHLLGDYFVGGAHHNEVFDLLSFLVNGIWTQRPVQAGPLRRTLPSAGQPESMNSSTSGALSMVRDAARPLLELQ
jgi:hypothetical protein